MIIKHYRHLVYRTREENTGQTNTFDIMHGMLQKKGSAFLCNS